MTYQAAGDETPNGGISVIICAYTEDRWDDIVRAIQSIKQQTYSAREIILVIDHNRPLFEHARSTIEASAIVENTSARGLSGARNCGLAVARGDFIAFLDDDAVAAPDWLERLHAHCAQPGVLGAGGWVEPHWVDSQPAWFPDEFLWVVGCSYVGLPRSTASVRNPFGGCSCLRREVFEQVGGFRTEIGRVGARPLGCEETELSIRARQHWPGRTFVHEPRATIRHKVPAVRGTARYFTWRCYSEGLSKAWLARRLGARDGLASERRYVTRVLPSGVMRGVLDGLLHHDTGGFGRAGAIILGLGFTSFGYLVGRLNQSLS
ncbi:MAG: glycosyltransferase [Chloroflexota bacterium]|nr:glycosyltransferase [Chloroflexota bacterium]